MLDYDISPDAFKKYMMMGLGRTYKIIENASNIDLYRDVVLYGCVNNLSYDVQMEGTRAKYVFDLMKYFKEDQFFEKQVLSKFNNELDYSTFCHLCDMLSLFYSENQSDLSKLALEEGYKLFTLKQVFDYNDKLKFDYLCVRLKYTHGIKMVRKICLDIDSLVENEILLIDDLGWFFSTIKESYKNITSFINEKCSHITAKDIDNVFDFEKNEDEQEILLNTDHIINKMKQDNWKLIWAFRFAKKASEEEKIKLVRYLELENNEVIKKRILQIINIGRFQIAFDYLVDLYKKSSDYLKHTILNVMINIEDEKIKLFGYSLLADDNLRHFGLEMICKFYDKTDLDTLLTYVPRVPVTYDEYGWHSLYSVILDLIDVKNHSAPLELLKVMYENSLCSFCRELYLLRMKKFNVISNDIIEECICDSNSDIRKFSIKLMKKTNI